MHKTVTGRQGESDDGKLNAFTKACGVMFLGALVYLLFQALLSGTAYLNQYRVNAMLDRWYAHSDAATLPEWQELELFALSSLQGNEDNATMLNAVGRLYDYRSAKMEKSWREKKLYGEQAIVYYWQVTQNRPAWPYGWMNLALSRARLNMFDDEFERSLLQLLQTGPWESATLPTIVQLSLFSWRYLDADSHQLILDYFITAQEKRSGEVARVVKSSGRLGFYCALLEQRGEKAGFCR